MEYCQQQRGPLMVSRSNCRKILVLNFRFCQEMSEQILSLVFIILNSEDFWETAQERAEVSVQGRTNFEAEWLILQDRGGNIVLCKLL